MMGVYGAVDIGASGGRVMAGVVDGGRIQLDVVHRFDNQVTERDGSFFWDIQRLYDEVIIGLEALATAHPDVVSIGIDTWAVDYGLLDATGELLGDPYAYRDGRTLRQAQGKSAVDTVHQRLPAEELYAITGLQFLPFNTVYQIAAEQQGDRWPDAAHALLLPDLLGFWLTGRRRSESTNASTTGLYDATTRDWSKTIMKSAGVPDDLFPPVVQPGSVLGPLLPGVLARTGLPKGAVVTAVGSHDTASAVVAVPAQERDVAYISSGTWSLVGVELDAPILTEESRAANFTNEGGVDGRVRYLRNAGGLWLLSECLREWDSAGEQVDLAELIISAEQESSTGALIDVDDEEFIAPGQMPERIAAALERTGQPVPTTRPGLTRCILESLAHAYADIVDTAAKLSGRPIRAVHVVGGGSQNALLCQLTADRCGLPVIAGPVEATALGNVLVQARADGAINGSLEDLRRLVADSVELNHYVP